MALLKIETALEKLLTHVQPMGVEDVPISKAYGRVIACDIKALRTQPPFAASAMDGYAIRAQDLKSVPQELEVIGESAAGQGFDGEIKTGQCVRIFTGAPLPKGADSVLIQENTQTINTTTIKALVSEPYGRYVRPAGLDFEIGEVLLSANTVLNEAKLSLVAAANHPKVSVYCRPKVAILATGDELVAPGKTLGRDQIIASNSYGIGAIAQACGAQIIDLGIANDTIQDISHAIDKARDERADVIITLGGASVGDHDLAQKALTACGMKLDFWKIAMRPGKPLMVGHLGDAVVLGLPGNPVSSIVCSWLFLKPVLAKFWGQNYTPDLRTAKLLKPLGENDERQDYIRAVFEQTPDGLHVTPFGKQDSSQLKTLAKANCLLIREPFAKASSDGENVTILVL